jgi:uncharacterized membrane protein YqiK
MRNTSACRPTRRCHGHLRSIIGGLSVEDLIANRNELAQATRDASSDEMQKLGLVIDSLQIQEIIDPTGYIRALGEPRAAEVKMKARIAQAAADREATEREQEAEALKAAAAESFKHVDNLTVINGAQGISKIIAQVIGQAGPALEMAQTALGRANKNGATAEEKKPA